MQSICRNFGVTEGTLRGRPKFRKPMKRGGLTGYEEKGTGSRANGDTSKIDTMCRFRLAWDAVCPPGSSGFNGRGIHHQNWDVVLNGINAAARAALQTFPILFQHQRLLAHGTNHNIVQILKNHNTATPTPLDP